MPIFRDTDHLYEVFEAFFQQLTGQDDVAEALLAGKFILRFRYTDPDGQVTIDLREPPITWVFGESDLKPDLEMIQSGDIAHQFWLGRLNIARAIATRKVVSRGPVSKALKLLPAIKPAYPIYAQVLRDIGYADMLPPEKPDERGKMGLLDALERAFGRVTKRISAPFSRKSPVVVDGLNAKPIPLVADLHEVEVAYRDPNLPTKPAALRLEMLDRMMLIRAFEEKLSDAYAKGEVPTEAIHLSIGQEATAVGVCFALRADDYVATTHRGHGHMLAKGADLDGMMAEMMAKATGLCRGKGGSMHVTESEVGAIGANGIVGASPLVSSGAAHSALLRGTDQVAVAFLGDGATNQGMFHEALNFAAVFDLPVVFVVENNQYGEFTPIDRHTRVTQIADRAAAYGIPGVTVDGNDVQAVYDAATEAVEKARKGEGPILLECLTYRWHGHMEGEAASYRTADEINEWKAKCPIVQWRKHLSSKKQLSKAKADARQKAAVDEVEAAFEKAKKDPSPSPEELRTEIFAPDPAYLYRGAPMPSGDREITCSQALFEAITEEMERDERVYMLGEDVATGGYFAVTVGLVDQFGTKRIVDTPISEYAIVGSAVGSALTGCRPVAEILFSDFLTTCMDPLVNQAAKLRYMSGGQYSLPMVVRTPGGAGLGMAAQHSQSLEALLTGIPGLIIVAPATPYDAKGLLKASIRSNNPVVFFENKLMYTMTGVVPEGEVIVPLGVADVKRAGADVTVVSVGAALSKALDAAEEVASEGVDVEVVDVRTLVPLDIETIVRSVVKTGRLVTVEEGTLGHGFGSEVVARVAESAFAALKAPPVRVASVDVPIPYDSALENLAIPDVARICDAISAVRAG